MMSASITTGTTVDELDELEHAPMTDPEHLAACGWAWDDPNAVEGL